MKESVLNFTCEGEALVGILAEPEGAPADVGVLIIVGGPQYRAGSHRQFTLLARHLASNGFAALRFDYRGMGDSAGETRDFLAVDADITAAVDALLASQTQLKRVVLWGLCDAASATLLYLERQPDPRVVGLALANPWVRSTASLARTHVKHYYGKRLLQAEFWLKLLRGGVGLDALKSLMRTVKASRGPAADTRGFQQRMAAGWRRTRLPILLMLSGDDYTAKEFLGHASESQDWAGLLSENRVSRIDFPGADHTFSEAMQLERLTTVTHRWLQDIAPSP
ncbi:hydrolase 1, exosortase A system-associated [Roseateles sp.]|uniref:hydrolase 1, exosortase A system-associated n=1 Tax=Roseateles sp. TaxID=1971397 RepID=UPI003266EB25